MINQSKPFLYGVILFVFVGTAQIGASQKLSAQDMQDDAIEQEQPFSENAIIAPSYDMEPILEEEQESISIEMMDKPVVRIRMLNKITAATRTYDLDIDSPVSFEGLRIQPRACRKAPPIANPESAAFLEIWEIPAGSDKPSWIFSGWMFSSSPGLSAMDHPIFDVWVLDCLDEKGEGMKPKKDDEVSKEKTKAKPEDDIDEDVPLDD